MSAPIGNKHAAKAKVWSAAIERALEKRYGKDRIGALAELAEKLLLKCEEGDMTALKELGDRMEGKAAQSIDATITRAGDADRVTDDILANIATRGGAGTAKTKGRKASVH